MGCDIHIIAEVKVDGKWQPNQDKIFPNPSYEPEAKHEWQKDEFKTEPDDNRSYDWFSVLADVRNGRGFAGISTGEGFKVIAEPRGVPDDASEQWKETVERWGSDMHSQSWLNISDFDKFDWNQVSMKRGVITLDEYKKLRGTNQSPDYWCGSVGGGNTRTLTEEEADKFLDSGSEPNGESLYVAYQWSVLYSDWFKWKIQRVIEPLRELTKKYGDARLCFGFDN